MRIVAELVAIVVATATTDAPLYNQSTQVNRNIVDSINFNFYQDSNHTLQLTQAYLGEQIYARIETDPTVENLNLQINSCYATSTSDSGTKFKVQGCWANLDGANSDDRANSDGFLGKKLRINFRHNFDFFSNFGLIN